jgi:hypothetical protein
MSMIFQPRTYLTSLEVMALNEHDIPTPNSSEQAGLYTVQNYNFASNFV